jgi:siroheme synthase-like protein
MPALPDSSSVAGNALLPVALDLRRLSVALVGRGARAARRLKLLDEAGAARLTVYSDRPSQPLAERAGARLVDHLPRDADLAEADLVFVADLNEDEACAVAGRARALRRLVNVEDVTTLCDVQSMSVVRRGDVAIGINTGGTCPMLARGLRAWIDRLLPSGFGQTARRLADLRTDLRANGGDLTPLEDAVALALTDLPALPPDPRAAEREPALADR